MKSKKIVFAVHDTTTYRCFQPIIEALPDAVSIEYLLLDQLFGESLDFLRNESTPARNATDYVRASIFERMNQGVRPGPLHVEMFQRLFEDRVSPLIAYDLKRYWQDTLPDLFVCGHDRLPFVKHLIKMCHDRGVPSAVVQHGVQNLRPVASGSILTDCLRPSTDPIIPQVEFAKRWLFQRYGAYIFCNPYLDVVYTMGDFFTEEIRMLREDFPAFGKTEVVTAGYPEYDLRRIEPYDQEIENCVFISGWEYEAGEWDDAMEWRIVDRLRQVAEMNDIGVTVRPHPKDSPEKLQRFYADFPLSETGDLKADIERHDLVLTVFSTALMLGVAEGKPCGVVDLPWKQNDFGPFEDDHLIPLTSSNVEVHERARERSRETQERYLRRYCFIPGIHSDSGHQTPGEYIAAELVSLTPNGESNPGGTPVISTRSDPL